MSQRQAVLKMLREAQERGVSFNELNERVNWPQKKIAELRQLGHVIVYDRIGPERIWTLEKDAHYCQRCGEFQVKPRKNLRCIWCTELEALARERVAERAAA